MGISKKDRSLHIIARRIIILSLVNKHFDMFEQRRTFTCGVRSIDVKEKYIKPTRVFELEDGVGIYRNRRR